MNEGPCGYLVVGVAEIIRQPRCGLTGESAATKLLVVFIFFRTFVGFLHDIAPCAQRFSDAGKLCFFSGRKTVHIVTDFVEHIDDAVDTLERVGDFSRRLLPSSPLERKVHRQNLAALRQAFAQRPGCNGIVGGP